MDLRVPLVLFVLTGGDVCLYFSLSEAVYNYFLKVGNSWSTSLIVAQSLEIVKQMSKELHCVFCFSIEYNLNVIAGFWAF